MVRKKNSADEELDLSGLLEDKSETKAEAAPQVAEERAAPPPAAETAESQAAAPPVATEVAPEVAAEPAPAEPPAAPEAPAEPAAPPASVAAPASAPPDPVETARLLEKYLPPEIARVGDIVKGAIVEINDEYAVMDIGHKAEGIVPLREMRQAHAPQKIQPGDVVTAYVLRPETARSGITELSIDRAQAASGWHKLEEQMNEGVTLSGEIVDLNRGGLIVESEWVRGFVPLSHVDAPYRDVYSAYTEEGDEELDLVKIKEELVGQQIEFKVLDFNRRRGRAIFSHRMALRDVRKQQKVKIMETLKEGDQIKGKIVGLSDFGAFVDIGGADGLIHISEMSWEQVRKPSAILSVGQEVDVYVLKIDRDEEKIALSLKRLQPEPWKLAENKFKEGDRVKVVVTNIVPFGVFARVMPGVEGLIHVSEMAYKKINDPADIVSEGDELEVEIMKIETERKRLALSLKRLLPPPADAEERKKDAAAKADGADADSKAEAAEQKQADATETKADGADEPKAEVAEATKADDAEAVAVGASADANANADAEVAAEPEADAQAPEADDAAPAATAESEKSEPESKKEEE